MAQAYLNYTIRSIVCEAFCYPVFQVIWVIWFIWFIWVIWVIRVIRDIWVIRVKIHIIFGLVNVQKGSFLGEKQKIVAENKKS